MPAFQDEVRAMAQGQKELSPYDRWSGIRFVELGDGVCKLGVDVDERFHNPAHVLHGGILSGLCDSAMAYAVSTRLDPEDSVTNVDLTIRFVRATVRDALVATGRVVKAGRSVIVVECDVHAADGELVARASSTFIRRASTGGAGWLGKAKPA